MKAFKSSLAKHITAFIKYREALGYSGKTYEGQLFSLDRYCEANYPDEDSLTKDMALGWLEEQHSGLNEKALAVRMLGRYMEALGLDAYVLYEKYASDKRNPNAYVFTDDELCRLFAAIDEIKSTKNEPFITEIAPVLFRLTYTCGLRPNEGRMLKCENINLKTGEILITDTKGKKERLVVMSSDMSELCRSYNERRKIFAKGNAWFFPSWSGAAFESSQISSFFKDSWKRANPNIPPGELARVRVYDLRHRFASKVLIKWLDEGASLSSKLPYLRAYMGHGSLSETAYYIHLLPENLLKSSGIDWESFDEIVPEVVPWDE